GLLIPFLIERGEGYTPTQTQQLMLSMQLSLIVVSLFGGWLYSRRSTPAIGVLSIGAIALGLAGSGASGRTCHLSGCFRWSPCLALVSVCSPRSTTRR
ncbi:MAG: hypothetical protein LC797_21640, partial [Chloroflexi bacterium]|nr:hypothetical protein [Chloroflexota bacterium]